MKPTLFWKAGIQSLFIVLTLLLFQAPLFGADRPASSGKTIVLDESRIKGAGSVAKGAGGTGSNEPLPALSTPLPWEGEQGGDSNIAQEIFRQLGESDPSYFMEDQLKTSESFKGEKHGNR